MTRSTFKLFWFHKFVHPLSDKNNLNVCFFVLASINLFRLNLSSGCVSVCLYVIESFALVTHLNISAKWSQIFTKLSANVKIGLLNWLIMFVVVHMTAFMHSICKCPRNSGQPLRCICFAILKPFLAKNERKKIKPP